MQGVILAAGRGARLHPLTQRRSKAMVPVAGKPLVARVLDQLVAAGLREFVIVVAPEDEALITYLAQPAPKLHLQLVPQPQRLGMADALRCAAPWIEGDFVLAACDNLVPPEHLEQLLAAWQATPRPDAVLSLLPVPRETLGSVGVVVLEGERVVQIVEKPRPEEAPSTIVAVPLYLFSRRLLDYLPDLPLSPRGEYELPTALQRLLEAGGRVVGVTMAWRLTVTNIADLLAVNRYYLTHEPQPVAPAAVGPGTSFQPPVRVEPGVVIGPGCQLGPYVCLERDCRIGAGAIVREALVLRGATVPAQAVVVGTVVESPLETGIGQARGAAPPTGI